MMTVGDSVKLLHSVSQSMQEFSQGGLPVDTKCELNEEEPAT